MTVSLADFAGDLAAAVQALPASGGCVFVPAGTWTLPGPCVIDLSRDKIAALTIQGEGAASIIRYAGATGDGVTLTTSSGQDAFNLQLRGLSIQAATTGCTLRFGLDDCTTAINRLLMDGVNVRNDGAGQACQMCGIYEGSIFAEFVTAGWGGLIIRQCIGVVFNSCNVGAMDGLALWITQGWVCNNEFFVDIEAAPGKGRTTAVVIDAPQAMNNVFRQLTISGVQIGMIATAGSGNVIEKTNWNELPKSQRCPQSRGLSFAPGAEA